MKRFAISLLGLCLAAAAGSAVADTVYRWVDAQGVVSYGSKPPPNAAGLRTVVLDPAQPSDATGSQRMNEDLAEAEKQRLERQKAQQKADAEKSQAEARRQKAILEAQREQHQQECASGALLASDCNDVNLGYYPVIGYRGPHPYITQTPPTPKVTPVVRQSSPVSKPQAKTTAN
jgi:hypothetical protein